MLTTQLHLAAMLKMSGAILTLPLFPSWCRQWLKVYLIFLSRRYKNNNEEFSNVNSFSSITTPSLTDYIPSLIFSTESRSFRFLWPCIVSKLWSERENQQDATVRCLLSILSQHVSGIIMPQENKTYVTACGVLHWFCWMWLVAVVGRCVVGCEQ